VASTKLRNYLRVYRKRCGFSQEELAYLVKLSDKSAWCNLERFHRQPSLRTALACEEVFGIPASQLFAGTKMEEALATRRRMHRLRRRLAVADGNVACFHRLKQKVQWLGQRLGEIIPTFSLS
jgi:DNA-binding XRE family transcriptional regulator